MNEQNEGHYLLTLQNKLPLLLYLSKVTCLTTPQIKLYVFYYLNFYNLSFKKDFIYLFLESGEKREKRRERNIDWLSPECPQLGPGPLTQAHALPRNGTGDLFLVECYPPH